MPVTSKVLQRLEEYSIELQKSRSITHGHINFIVSSNLHRICRDLGDDACVEAMEDIAYVSPQFSCLIAFMNVGGILTRQYFGVDDTATVGIYEQTYHLSNIATKFTNAGPFIILEGSKIIPYLNVVDSVIILGCKGRSYGLGLLSYTQVEEIHVETLSGLSTGISYVTINTKLQNSQFVEIDKNEALSILGRLYLYLSGGIIGMMKRLHDELKGWIHTSRLKSIAWPEKPGTIGDIAGTSKHYGRLIDIMRDIVAWSIDAIPWEVIQAGSLMELYVRCLTETMALASMTIHMMRRISMQAP